MQEITVKEKNVYGKILLYPVCDKAIKFAQLLGVKTLTPTHIHDIELLEYKVNVIRLA